VHLFYIDAGVVLPDRTHCLWTSREGDADFPGRWRAIKTGFAKSLPIGEPRSPVMASRGERGIWQRRYWEHTIRDDRDFAAHMAIRSSTRSSMVSWRTRRTGRIRHFADASPVECIPPTGGAAAMSRNRLANAVKSRRRKQAEGHGHSISRARRPTSPGGMRYAVPPYACFYACFAQRSIAIAVFLFGSRKSLPRTDGEHNRTRSLFEPGRGCGMGWGRIDRDQDAESRR
jgi:hypothetical protein